MKKKSKTVVLNNCNTNKWGKKHLTRDLVCTHTSWRMKHTSWCIRWRGSLTITVETSHPAPETTYQTNTIKRSSMTPTIKWLDHIKIYISHFISILNLIIKMAFYVQNHLLLHQMNANYMYFSNWKSTFKLKIIVICCFMIECPKYSM